MFIKAYIIVIIEIRRYEDVTHTTCTETTKGEELKDQEWSLN